MKFSLWSMQCTILILKKICKKLGMKRYSRFKKEKLRNELIEREFEILRKKYFANFASNKRPITHTIHLLNMVGPSIQRIERIIDVIKFVSAIEMQIRLIGESETIMKIKKKLLELFDDKRICNNIKFQKYANIFLKFNGFTSE